MIAKVERAVNTGSAVNEASAVTVVIAGMTAMTAVTVRLDQQVPRELHHRLSVRTTPTTPQSPRSTRI